MGWTVPDGVDVPRWMLSSEGKPPMGKSIAQAAAARFDSRWVDPERNLLCQDARCHNPSQGPPPPPPEKPYPTEQTTGQKK